VQPDLLALLVCPSCHGDLTGFGTSLDAREPACTRCGATYAVRDGIPILLPPGFDDRHVHDEIDHAWRHSHGHKHAQAGYYDRSVAEEFEITRPDGAPEAYAWLLERKFRRSIERLPSLRDATVVDVCCGSGMDAGMLARAGARVIAADISEGCVRRARERARRMGLDYLAIVADVEHLPLRDRAVDIAYVHDGLHHLDDPTHGLREMMRVASRAVSVNEPADALGTALAVKLGLALDREDAGNRVARLRLDDVARAFDRGGFDHEGERYLMHYRHEPDAIVRFASKRCVAPLYRAAVSAADATLGRWGNKLHVTGTRRAA
jgi:SAM-dependent methyltransferase